MSQYYNPHRKASWNYGGENWKLSRSKIDFFMECPRCFYLDNKLGTKRPASFPFNLNSAVDSLLKQEFDGYRVKGEQHPLQKEYGIDAVPAKHVKMDEWRENFEGVRCLHEPTGLTIVGAIDDLWVNEKGEHIVVDYKATAKSEAVTELDQDWQIGYKRQMEVYQWLLRRNDLVVSDLGYFVYCTGRPDELAFDGKLEFDVNLIPYQGDDQWVEPMIEKIKECLDSDEIPVSGKGCDYCDYRKAMREIEVEKKKVGNLRLGL